MLLSVNKHVQRAKTFGWLHLKSRFTFSADWNSSLMLLTVPENLHTWNKHILTVDVYVVQHVYHNLNANSPHPIPTFVFAFVWNYSSFRTLAFLVRLCEIHPTTIYCRSTPTSMICTIPSMTQRQALKLTWRALRLSANGWQQRRPLKLWRKHLRHPKKNRTSIPTSMWWANW